MKNTKSRSGIAGMFGGMTATLLALVALLVMATGAGASLRQNNEDSPPDAEPSTTAEGVVPEVTRGPQTPPTPVRIVAEEAETGGATSTGPFVLVGDSIFDVTSVCLTNPLEGAQNMIIEGLRLDSATVRMTLRFDGGFRGAEVIVNERAVDGTTVTTTAMIAADAFALADGRGSGISNGEPVAFDTTRASISQCASAPAAETDASDTVDTDTESDLPESNEGDVVDAGPEDMTETVDTDETDAVDGETDPVDGDQPSSAAPDEDATSTGDDDAEAASPIATDETDDDMADGDMADGDMADMDSNRTAAAGAWLTVLGAEPVALTATCLDLSTMGAYSLKASVVAAGSPIDSVSVEPTSGGMAVVVRNAQGVVTHLSGPNATQIAGGDGLSEVAAIAQSMENVGIAVPLQIMMTNAPLHPCGDLGIEFGESSDASGIGSAYLRTGDAGTATFMTVIGACEAMFPGGSALAVRLTSFDDAEESTAFGYGRSVGIRDSTLIIGDRTFRHATDSGLTQVPSPDGMLVLSGDLVDTAVASADLGADDHVMIAIAMNTDLIGQCPTAES